MGDRSNIVVQFDERHQVVFYTHWQGSALPSILQEALIKARAGGRLDDAPYLARIIFCTMVDTEWEGTDGFGIYYDICEEEHETLYVDCENQAVTIGAMTWTFENYINQTLE